jgi:2-succinyl-6-hydroxy-2,4-cyclohexadiene-1-carboxylate synthase
VAVTLQQPASPAPTLPARRYGSGPARLVLLHGFTGGGRSFEHLFGEGAPLELDVQALCPDLPGHGDAPALPAAPGEPFTAAAALVARTAAKAFGGPIHLAGYSMGARLALAVALEFPQVVRSLVLESGGAGLASPALRAERRAADEELAKLLDREGLRAFLAKWEVAPVLAGLQALPQPVQDSLRERRLRNDPHGLAWSLRALGQGAQPSYWHRLSELQCPVLLLHGEKDEKFTQLARRLSQQLPRARLVQLEQIDGAGHTPHLEQPALYAGALRRFLAAAA